MRKIFSFFLSSFLLVLFSCSNFQNTTTVTLTFSSGDFERSAARDIVPDNKQDGYYIVASIRGDYNSAQTDFMSMDGGKCTFSFESVPVGAKVYAEVNAFRSFARPDEEGVQKYRSPNIHELTGKSETIKVATGENCLNLEMKDFDDEQTSFEGFSMDHETSDEYTEIVLSPGGKYYIMEPDFCIYSEGTWRFGDSDCEKPFESEKPFTLYLTEYVYGKEEKKIETTPNGSYPVVYTTPVIVELPEEKAIEIKSGRSPFIAFTSKSGKTFTFGEDNCGDEPPTPSYTVTFDWDSNLGDIDFVMEHTLPVGEEVYFTVTPDDGYRVKSVTVKYSSGDDLNSELEPDDSGYYRFNMPEQDVCVAIEFESIAPEGFVYVEGMTFYGNEDINPATEILTSGVTIPNLYVCDHEVTQGEYETYCGYSSNQPSSTSGIGTNKPAHYISWYDAIVYCNLRSMAEDLQPVYSLNNDTAPKNWAEIQNKGSAAAPKYCGPTTSNDYWNAVSVNENANGYRLPTEAEWEYAARGGEELKKYNYSGSDYIGDVGWCDSNSNADSGCLEVKSEGIRPNTLGIYDMSGNILEWCWDIDYLYTEAGYRVFRGGHYSDSEDHCKVNYRSSTAPKNGYATYGFRVVRNAE